MGVKAPLPPACTIHMIAPEPEGETDMAHALGAPGAPALLRNSDLDTAEVLEARRDLAACFRMAARLGLHEGICNHFSLMVPGRDDLFLVNPYGYAFAEVTASRLLVCDFHGNVVAGDGVPEATAFFIHARVHANVPRARACFHTHMPYATALAMVEGEPLAWAGQSALKFYGRTRVDRDYNGLALDESEGDRIAPRSATRMSCSCATTASWWWAPRPPRPGTTSTTWNARRRRRCWPRARAQAGARAARHRRPHLRADARGRRRERAPAHAEHPRRLAREEPDFLD
jgi:hypothetical protein